jgi:glucosylceramidase
MDCNLYEGNKISWYLTSPEGKRVDYIGEIAFTGRREEGPPVIRIDEGIEYQRMDGFGATFNESGWYLLNLLDESARDRVLKAFFHPDEGSGYTVCAAPIGHNDYSLSYYSFNETDGDINMENFSIQRDKGCLIPYIKSALRYNRFILATRPDYPPRWMLDGEKRLQRKYYDAFSLYLLKYVLEYEKEGITVDYISVFNEPMIYTQITGEEIGLLIKDHLGPLFEKHNIKTKIQATDAFDRGQACKEWPPVLDDPDARKYVSTATFHGYWWERSTPFMLGSLYEKYRDIPIWQTECMNLYTKPILEYVDGEVWGKMILDDINNGVAAWIFWNMLVDEHGGPWNQDPFNPGFEQDGIAVINQEDRSVTYTAKYYYFTHFSRFIKPGAVRIHSVDVEDNLKWVRFSAFKNPDGNKVFVVLNSNQHEAAVRLEYKGNSASIRLPGHSIATLLWR